MRAVLGGHTEAVEVLLAAPGIDINAKTATGKTALSACTPNDALRTSLLLMLATYCVRSRHPSLFSSCHHATVIAAGSGYEDIASALLLDDELDVNACDSEGKTALIHACQTGNYDMALLLLIYDSISMDVTDKAGSTALMYATAGNHQEIVDLLTMKEEEAAAAK